MSSWIKEEYIDKTDAKVAKIENDISVIPAQVYAEGNELADKTWVNSTIATSTGYFRGTYQKIEDLPDISDPYVVDPPYSNNDYAFVLSTDEEETPVYAKFKIVETEGHLEWKFEYFLNNSSFTAVQWAAINSGVTESFVNKLKDFNPENAISAVYVDGTTIVKGPSQYGILSVGTLSSDQIEMGLGDNNFGGQGAFGKISLHYQESDADTNSVKVVQDSIDPVSETSLREAAYFKANSIDY